MSRNKHHLSRRICSLKTCNVSDATDCAVSSYAQWCHFQLAVLIRLYKDSCIPFYYVSSHKTFRFYSHKRFSRICFGKFFWPWNVSFSVKKIYIWEHQSSCIPCYGSSSLRHKTFRLSDTKNGKFWWVFTKRKRSLAQGNVLTPVCHSVHTGGGFPACTGRGWWLSSMHWNCEKWAVCILLVCFLVWIP